MKTFFKYLLATGTSIGYAYAYLTRGLAHLRGHDLGYANVAFMCIAMVLLLANLPYFIPNSWLRIKYLLPGMLTCFLLLILLVYSRFQVGDIFAFVYVPFLINATWGGAFFRLQPNPQRH